MILVSETSSKLFDLIIIGAGINGAGIARDASLRGLKVMLLDKDDIASGTSAYSTRLIHGGLRYLEHGELGLVRESLRERETLLRIAPHLVRPLPILIPIYGDMKRGRAKIRTGMIAYDLLSLDKSLPGHHSLSVSETLRIIPALKRDGLRGAVIYYDAQVEFAERLVFENVLSAIENETTLVTHALVEDLVTKDNQVVGLKYRPESSGQTKTVEGRFFVNAAGPWIDRVLARTDATSDTQLIGGTKGSHIVVPPFIEAGSNAIYGEAKSDRRPFFIIPWNGNYLIGTTDVRFEGDPDEVRVETYEVDYLLNETNRLFPNANLTQGDILYTYSGVRPLPYTSENEERITRRHFVKQDHQFSNLVSIVGGKLTTFRSLAEECIEIVFRKLGMNPVRCCTSDLPLPGAKDFRAFANELVKQTELAFATKKRLLRIYGSRAREVVEFCESSGLSNYLDDQQTTLTGEIAFSFQKEYAVTLTDCLMRRTMIGLNGDLGLGQVDAAAQIAKENADWSDERVENELQKYRSFAQRRRQSIEQVNAD